MSVIDSILRMVPSAGPLSFLVPPRYQYIVSEAIANIRRRRSEREIEYRLIGIEQVYYIFSLPVLFIDSIRPLIVSLRR